MNFKKFFLSVVAIVFIYFAEAQQLTIGTYNVRNENQKLKGN